MSKIIKNSEVNDFWLDCFKENNNNNKSNSNFPKKNISQNLAFKPLIKYNSQLKRNKRIYKHDNNLSYQNWRIGINIAPEDINAYATAANLIAINSSLYDSLYFILFSEYSKR